MRRGVLALLRCPKCQTGPLRPDDDTAELIFGPLRCTHCQTSYPVSEGVAELVPERQGSPGLFQRNLERPEVARAWERYVRPAIQLGLARRRLDRESEYLLYRSVVGVPRGPLLDLQCGTGLFARRLARESGMPAVIGLDVSRAMIEEAVAQTREAGVMVDFVRAEAPGLPFLDDTLGAVLQTGALHLIEDLGRSVREVGRVLRPGGIYVASTYLPPGPLGTFLHRKAGLHPHPEEDLRSAAAAAGLVAFERMVLPPFILVRAQKPGS